MDKDLKLNKNQYQKTEDEIDLQKIINIFIRNKSIVVGFTIILFVLSSIFSLSKKKIWEGEFQIVVKNIQNNITKIHYQPICGVNTFG